MSHTDTLHQSIIVQQHFAELAFNNPMTRCPKQARSCIELSIAYWDNIIFVAKPRGESKAAHATSVQRGSLL